MRALARALGRDHALVSRWRRVPYAYLLKVEQATGVPREILRPEMFR